MSRAESQVLDMYVEGINSGDVDQIPLADDVVFVGPMLDTPLQGADAVRDFLSQVSEGLKAIHVQRHVIDDQDACSLVELEAANGTVVPACDYFRIINGRIAEVRPYFDPRPLLPV